ncbi:MAG: MFS transporter [Vulcanimicrobiaceae bacterium]
MSPVRGRYAMLALVTTAQAGGAMIQQGLGSLAPFLAAAFALNHAELGLAFGLLVGGSALATAPAGLAVDAWGERRMILFSGLVMGTALIAAAASHAYLWLLTWLVVAGIGYAASTPAGGRAILLWFERDRGMAMSIRQTGVPVGGMVGALILPPIAAFASFRAAFIVAGAICALSAIVAAIFYRGPPETAPIKRTLAQILAAMGDLLKDRRAILVTLCCMALVSVQTVMITFLTITLAGRVSLSLTLAAIGLAIAQVGASVGRIISGLVSDRYFGGDRLAPMAILVVIAALASVGIGLVPRSALGLAFFVSFVLGFSSAGWNGLMAAVLVEIGGAERAGSALGIALTGVFGMGFIVPPLFGALADRTGLEFAWIALGIASLIGLVPALAARRLIARSSG